MIFHPELLRNAPRITRELDTANRRGPPSRPTSRGVSWCSGDVVSERPTPWCLGVSTRREHSAVVRVLLDAGCLPVACRWREPRVGFIDSIRGGFDPPQAAKKFNCILVRFPFAECRNEKSRAGDSLDSLAR